MEQEKIFFEGEKTNGEGKGGKYHGDGKIIADAWTGQGL